MTPRSAIALLSTGLKLAEASACSIFSQSAALCAIASQQVSVGIASKRISYAVPKIMGTIEKSCGI
jgi:hypothetical protein